MRVQLFTFRYSATLGGFDDSPLADFVRDREVVAFREYFSTVNDVPHLTCVLTWRGRRRLPPRPRTLPRDRAPRTRRTTKRRERKRPDPTAGLDETERALFNTLREWRARRAKQEGVPSYIVSTNRHLLELVRRRPDSPTALTAIHGIGKGKVERYAPSSSRRSARRARRRPGRRRTHRPARRPRRRAARRPTGHATVRTRAATRSWAPAATAAADPTPSTAS